MTYSSTLAISRQRMAPRNQNRTSFMATDRSLGPISNTIMLVVLACLLGLLYLAQVTKTNTYGYQINDLKQQQSALKDEHAQLEIAAARLKSLTAIEQSVAAKSLVSVTPTPTIQN